MRAFRFIPVVAVLALAACASPNRGEPGAFKQILSGRIDPAQQRPFVECLNDGFDKAHWAITAVTVRQQVRAETIRVETLSGPAVAVSADVNNDGTVALFELVRGPRIIISGEVDAFKACMVRFGKP